MYRYLALFLSLSSCAFKGEDPQAAASAISANASRQAEVSWQGAGGEVKVNRAVTGTKNFAIADPITVPPEIPDELKIEFNAPLVDGKLLQEPRVFITDQTDSNSVSPPVRLKGALEPSGISVSGLKTFFNVNKQQKGILRVSLMNAVTGDEEASLGMTLVTAPTSVEVSLVGRDTVRDGEIRKLTAPQLRLDLLFAFKISNKNSFRAEFRLPGELHGSIRKDYVRHDYFEQQCHTDTSVAQWTDTYSTKFFILPMDEGLRDTWIARMTDQTRNVTLNPGETRVLGVYASGAQIGSFMDNGCPVSHPGSVHVRLECDHQCDPLIAERPGDGGGGPGPRPCHTSTIYGDVPSGTETSGAYWIMEDASTLLKARNAFLSPADDPATRVVQFLPARLGIF